MLRALASSNNANILSTPSLLTTDNAEAEIVVGNNVPFPASGGLGGGNLGAAAAALGAASNANTAGLGSFAGLFGQQIQRQDVALTLKITPRVNASNFVTLEVDQVVEDIENPDTGGLDLHDGVATGAAPLATDMRRLAGVANRTARVNLSCCLAFCG